MANELSMLPPLTDFVALLCIDLVLCAALLRLFCGLQRGQDVTATPSWAKWVCAVVFVTLWLPVGAAHIPLLAYVRGVSSDFSMSSVFLVGIGLSHRFFGSTTAGARERMATYLAIAAGSVILYPLALGLGDWDPYRAGWGAPWLLTTLLLVVLVYWARGLRLLPALVALALLSWCLGLMESTNLWDYLLDPWISIAAVFQCVKAGWVTAFSRYRGWRQDTAEFPS